MQHNGLTRPGHEHDPFYARMVLVYRYGALAFAGLGLAWAVVFSAIGWWWVVALDFAIVASGLAIYVLIRRGHFRIGLLAAQAALAAIAISMGLLLDVPTDDHPRVSHLFLLVVAALGYLNYQREKSAAQLALIVFCLAACIHAMHADFVRRSDFSRDLTAALWNDEFRLVYQPQVDASHAMIGAEALIDVEHPKSHLTLGQYKGCRIPVDSPLTPFRFMRFILRNFYNPAYAHVNLDWEAQRSAFASVITQQEKRVLFVTA